MKDRVQTSSAETRGGGDVHVDDVGPQPLGRHLETGAGARGVFEEEVDDGAACQQVAPFVDGPVLVDVRLRKVEQARNGFRRQTFNAEQVVQPRHARAFLCH